MRWVQMALNKVSGLRLPLDGVTSVETRSAIRSFQQRKGLVVDGIVGPITERALLEAGAPPIPWASGGSTSSLVPGGGKASPVAMTCAGVRPKEVLDNFATDSSNLTPAHHTRLIAIAGCILARRKTANPVASVSVVGHTDPQGADAYNEALGQRRADEVKLWLAKTLDRMLPGSSKGVSISATSKGEREPASSVGAQNRRVEIFLPLAPPPVPPRRVPPRRPPRRVPPGPGPLPPDLALLVTLVGKVLSSLPLGSTGVKAPTSARFLDAKERAEAVTMYRGSLDFTRIVITDGLGFDSRPFTVAVNLPSGWYVAMNMGTLGSMGARPASETLIHELAHAWQSQHHPADPTAYMFNSIKCQGAAAALKKVTGKKYSAYAYRTGKAFGDYAAEQIANQVEHAYAGTGSPSPTILPVIRGVAPHASSPENVTSLGVLSFEERGAAGVF